jgi:hypothetical protein
MRRWQATALIVGAAALFLTARPAQAQVWVGPPVGVVPGPVVVSSGWSAPVGVVPEPVVVNTVWRGRPTWSERRAYRRLVRGW